MGDNWVIVIRVCVFIDSGKVLQQSDKSLQAIESRQMEAFAIHTQERIMGLLGAMIPRDNSVRIYSYICEF